MNIIVGFFAGCLVGIPLGGIFADNIFPQTVNVIHTRATSPPRALPVGEPVFLSPIEQVLPWERMDTPTIPENGGKEATKGEWVEVFGDSDDD